MQPAARRFLLLAAAAVLAIPALAQVQNVATAPAAQAPAGQQPSASQPAPVQIEGLEETDATNEVEVRAPPPVEYPRWARRDVFAAGALDPARLGLGADAWGQANGSFLSALMRGMDTPLASRWAHIGLRNALLAAARAPEGVNPVDWAAERAWLLLRMGEADAAQMLIASVDTDRFTPKMVQVAVQSSLANSDPLALCPLTPGMPKVEQRILPLARAICLGLNGEPEPASAQIESARRTGSVGGIDLALAQKVVGATSDTGTAATIEWEPVDSLTAWRFGLATATGMSPPKRLLDSAAPRVRAWYARAPLISLQDRLDSARIAAGLGVFSSQALTDVYASLYDLTDPNELGSTDSWQLRLAWAARDQETRLEAMRHLWRVGSGTLQKEASRALLAGAAARIQPDPDLQSDAGDLIASMLAAGMDRQAARWGGAVRRMDDEESDRSWAMLALAAPEGTIETSVSRVNAFIGRDSSEGHKRSALLVAGLAALGRLDAAAASRLNRRYGLSIEQGSRWTQMVDAAARRQQPGTVILLGGTGLQATGFEAVPSAHLFHLVMALRNTGQEYLARMIAAEALART